MSDDMCNMARSVKAGYGPCLCLLAGVAAAVVFVTLVQGAARSPRARVSGPPVDCGGTRQKCYSCVDQAGAAGGVQKCLTCGEPSFKYLTETIQAEMGARRACRGCRGAP
jgi:hypothetical protein